MWHTGNIEAQEQDEVSTGARQAGTKDFAVCIRTAAQYRLFLDCDNTAQFNAVTVQHWDFRQSNVLHISTRQTSFP